MRKPLFVLLSLTATAMTSMTPMTSGVARADAGVALGPVIQSTSDSVGVRAGVDASIFVVAAERYSFEDGDRTRAEVAVRLPLSLTRNIRLAPQVGIIPLDYVQSSSTGAANMDFSFAVTAALTLRIAGPVWLALEPIRAEKRFARVEVESSSSQLPGFDGTDEWNLSHWIALRVGF